MLPDGWGACDACVGKPVGITAVGRWGDRWFRDMTVRCDDAGDVRTAEMIDFAEDDRRPDDA